MSAPRAITKDGITWGEIVGGLEQMQDRIPGKAMAAMEAVEDALPAEYWEMEQSYTLQLPGDVAAMVEQAVVEFEIVD